MSLELIKPSIYQTIIIALTRLRTKIELGRSNTLKIRSFDRFSYTLIFPGILSTLVSLTIFFWLPQLFFLIPLSVFYFMLLFLFFGTTLLVVTYSKNEKLKKVIYKLTYFVIIPLIIVFVISYDSIDWLVKFLIFVLNLLYKLTIIVESISPKRIVGIIGLILTLIGIVLS